MLPLPPSTGMLELMLVLVTGVSLELWLTRRVPARPAPTRLWREVGAPLLRSAVIVGAVLVAYPALFGFRAAPALIMLLHETTAPGIGLFVALCMARLPAPRLLSKARIGFIDTVQGMGAVALLFMGFAGHVGAASAGPWPGALGALALLGMSALLPPLAGGLGHDVGARLDARRDGHGLARWLGEVMAMVGVAPIVVLYGYLLGMQLAM